MPRADNSDRQLQIIKPEDVSMATSGQPESFPYKKLNTILLAMQQKIYSLEGRTQPPILRNHLTILAPPVDPSIPEAGTDKAALFFNPGTNTLDAAESGATSFSDVVNRAGQWHSTGVTAVGSLVIWDTQIVSSAPFGWSTGTTSIAISEPGTYLIQTKLELDFVVGGLATVRLSNLLALDAFSQDCVPQVSGAVDVDLHHLYIWEKHTDTLDGVQVTFISSDDPDATINGLTAPAVLTIVKLK